MPEQRSKAWVLIQQMLFSTQDSQGRPVVSDASRVTQIVNTLKEHRMLTEEATELDLITLWMKRRREAGEKALTRGTATEVRHVCYYAAHRLLELREEVVKPGYRSGYVIEQVKEQIADLESLVKYVETGRGGASALGDRNA